MALAPAFSEPTTIGSYTEAIIRALEASGVDPLEVLRGTDVDRTRSTDPLVRITDSSIDAIFARAVAVTGDEYFGLRVAERVVVGMLHALGYAMLASETLEDMCHRFARYYVLVSQGGVVEARAEGDELLLEAHPHNPAICHETIDAWAGVVLRLARAVQDESFCPRQLELRRPVPLAGAQPYLDFFGCPVQFGSPHIRFHFDLRQARQPLAGASRELAQHNDRVAMDYIERLDRDDVVTRVRALLINGLSGGAFARTDIARRMHMSPSTLQARLARRGLSFQRVLDTTRHELALGYLGQSRLSITEIAFMLGFSDVSNFNRAFRRWTGSAPSGYRESRG